MIKKLCLVFLAFLALNVNAQEGTTSPYSFYGIGSLKFKGTVENRSMGGLSIYTDSIHVNLRNPASFSGNPVKAYNGEGRVVKFTVGGEHSSTKLETSTTSDRANATTFDYLAMSIPMGKFGVGIGILPYTSVGYKLESNIDNAVTGESVLGHRYRGEGGVNKVFLALAYQITEDLSVGLDASYNFGNITNSSIEYVYSPTDGSLLAYQSRELNESELSGINFNLGLSYKPMISDKLQLVSGLTFSPQSDLTSRNERIFSTIVISPTTGQEVAVNNIQADLASQGLDRTELTLPTRTSIGVGIGAPRKWFVGAEYTNQQTSKFSNRVLDEDAATNFVNASSFSLGGFYIPRYNSFGSYWKRVVYRAGMRFENTGLEIDNQKINEFGISFGVGLPVGRMFSNANLGFEYGQRGTTSQNLVKENFINFQISLSLNDRWFVKRKYN